MKSIIHTKSFTLDFPISKLFPLFSPEGEKHWVPGWDYENVMGKTDLCEEFIGEWQRLLTNYINASIQL
jgi:hypothetical protein